MSDVLTRPALTIAPAVEQQIADYLQQLLGPARPRRVSRMLDPGGDKYRDLPKVAPLSYSMLLEHASGRATYAATLDQGSSSRAGVIEVDQGGRSALTAVLRAAERLGLACYAIAVDNVLSGHSGGHVHFPYLNSAPVADIRAQLGTVVERAGLPLSTEIWPCAQVIRLPFGVHRWAQTRGTLILQSGELLELDSDPAGGLEKIVSIVNHAPLPSVDPIVSNTAPDLPASREAPQASTKGHYTNIPKVSPGERAAGRASLDEVKARFNAEHTIASLLESYGAVQTSAKDFSCPFGCGHSHTNTLYSYNGRVYSRSPNCTIPQKKGLDPFGVYVLIEHHDNVVSALKAINPVAPRQKPTSGPEPATNYRTAAQVADADRKRTARRVAAAGVQADVRARAAQDDELWPADRAVLDALLTIAGERDWCRPSKERIANDCGYSLGSVKRSLMKLARLGYFASAGDGSPKGRHQTAIRTFLCGSYFADETIVDPKNDPQRDIASTDPTPDQILACEGGAAAPEPEPTVNRALVDQLHAMDDAAFAAWFASHGQRSAPPPAVEPEADAATAAYIPGADWTAGGRLDLVDWRDPCEMRVRNDYVVDAPPEAQQAIPLDMPPEVEPLVLSPPADTLKRNRYYALRGKAKKKTTSDKQRYALNRQADDLLEWLPVTDARAIRRADHPPLTSSGPQAGPSRRQPPWLREGES